MTINDVLLLKEKLSSSSDLTELDFWELLKLLLGLPGNLTNGECFLHIMENYVGLDPLEQRIGSPESRWNLVGERYVDFAFPLPVRGDKKIALAENLLVSSELPWEYLVALYEVRSRKEEYNGDSSETLELAIVSIVLSDFHGPNQPEPAYHCLDKKKIRNRLLLQWFLNKDWQRALR